MGRKALHRYLALVCPQHRVDFWRYAKLFFDGGTYLDMKSAFVKHLNAILRRVRHCSFVSCIGEKRDHIHQGQIITIKYHPVLYEALLLILEVDASTLRTICFFVKRCTASFKES